MGNKCTCCKPPSTPQQLAAVGPTRKVFVGPELNHHRYPTNRIHTTKYTPLNFIPKALLLQFIKPANTIFLMTAILQCITVISALSPFTAIAPFVVVLGISLVREAYEDYVTISETQKRRRNDH